MPDRLTMQRTDPILIGSGLALSLLYGFLASESSGFGEARLSVVLACLAVAFAVTSALWWRYRPSSGLHVSLGVLLVFALAFRLIGLAAFPVLEDDFYRFLWDGWRVANGASPYVGVPADWFGRDIPQVVETALSGINYPDVGTVYGPTLQWAFALCHLIAPGSVTALQVLFASADCILLLMLARFAPSRWCLLYGWSPLVVKEFAMSAHPDVLGVLFLVVALVCAHKRFRVAAGALLALAAGVKVFAIVAVPFLLRFSIRGWCAFAVVAIGIAAPFGVVESLATPQRPEPSIVVTTEASRSGAALKRLVSGTLRPWFPDGLSAMSENWVFNAPIHTLAGSVSYSTGQWVRVICGGVMFMAWLVTFWRGRGRLRSIGGSARSTSLAETAGEIGLLYGLLLLLSPVLNPWYLVWWLPFMVLGRISGGRVVHDLTPWVASGVLPLSYVVGLNVDCGAMPSVIVTLWDRDLCRSGLYDVPAGLMAVQLLAITAALLWDRSRHRSQVT